MSLLFFIVFLGACVERTPLVREDGAKRVSSGLDSEQNPCLSPDGEQLLFTRFSRGYNRGPSALVLLDLSSGEEEILLSDGEHDFVNLPGRCFSSDGRFVAYSSDRNQLDQIWRLELATKNQKQLTHHELSSLEPSFTAEGQVVYERSDHTIWRVSPEDLGTTQLTFGGLDGQPSASPLQQGPVLFQSERGGTLGIWQLYEGQAPQAVWDSEYEETDASWSVLGHQIVFATDDCEALSCAAVFTLSSGELTTHSAPKHWYEGAPSLSVDGEIYVEARRGRPGKTAIYRLP